MIILLFKLQTWNKPYFWTDNANINSKLKKKKKVNKLVVGIRIQTFLYTCFTELLSKFLFAHTQKKKNYTTHQWCYPIMQKITNQSKLTVTHAVSLLPLYIYFFLFLAALPVCQHSPQNLWFYCFILHHTCDRFFDILYRTHFAASHLTLWIQTVSILFSHFFSLTDQLLLCGGLCLHIVLIMDLDIWFWQIHTSNFATK